jgi:hypothetical protein
MKYLLTYILCLICTVALSQSVPGQRPVIKSLIWQRLANAPASPVIGEEYKNTDGKKYEWNGSAWLVPISDIANIVTKEPTSPKDSLQVWKGTQAAFDSITPLTDGIYFIEDAIAPLLVNADIDSIAAIAGTKIAVDTTGTGYIGGTTLQNIFNETVTKIGDNTNNINTNSSAINVLAAEIDTIQTTLATPTISAFDFQTKTTSYSLVAADAMDNRYLLLDFDDNEDNTVTVSSGEFASGNAVRFQNEGTEDALIVPSTGVSFGLKDGFLLPAPTINDTVVKAITIARISSATSPEQWRAIDGYIQNYFEDPNAGNLFTSAFYGNLGSPTSSSAPAGLNNVSGTISVQNTSPFNGTTAMNFVGTTTLQFSYWTIPQTGLSVGNTITQTFKYRINTAGTQLQARLYDPTSSFTTFTLTGTTGVWYDGSITHTIGELTSGNLRSYLRGDGDFDVDNIKIIKEP